MIRKCCAFALYALLALGCVSTPAVPVESESAPVISDRLSNQRVNAFAQDREGHVWIATTRGLNKYTGQEYYQYFSTADSLGLPDNQISAIHASRDGRLWVGTINGVAVSTPQGTFRRLMLPDVSQSISQIFGTRTGKVLISNGTSLFVYDEREDCLRAVVRDFGSFGTGAVLHGDQIWSISSGGYVLNSYSAEDFSPLESIPLDFQAYHLCAFRDNELWISGMGQLRILDIRSASWLDLPAAVTKEKRLIDGDVDLMFAVDDNSLLLNVIGQGFFHYHRSRGTLTHQDSPSFPYTVPQTEVRTIFRDSQGNLWFGTTDQGYLISYQEYGLFGSNKFLTEALRNKNVVSLSTDKSGGLWICTLRDGLYRYDLHSHVLVQVPVDHLIPDSEVGYIRASGVFCDPDGDLWLIFQDKVRVIRCAWDGRRLSPKDIVYVLYPTCMAADDRGAVWIAGFSNTLTRYDKRDHSRSDIELPVTPGEWTYVTDMLLAEPGRLLAARLNHEPVQVNTYSLEVSPRVIPEEEFEACIRRSVLIPNCMVKDGAGIIWVGTYANGLIVFENGHFRPIPGAPCPDIASIEEDRQGNIWVSTLAGLGKYDRTTGTFVVYYEADGIGGDQFNNQASCILPDGTLVFGGTHGITWFNPLDTPAKRTVPLVFESLSVHNRQVQPSKDGPIDKVLSLKPQVTIKDDENALSISFAALDYSQYERIRYAYKLEGFDRDWVKIGLQHNAYYAHIPPGNYTFRVRIADGSHSITETEESLSIKVLPPWYGTWWARLLFFLAFVLVAFVVLRFYRHLRRVRSEAAVHIRAEKREREQAEAAREAQKELNRVQMEYFSNVAHEFRTPLTMISGPVSQLAASEEIKGQNRQLVGIIQRNAAWMLSLVGQLLDFNRIGNRKLRMKVAKMDVLGPLRDIADLFRFNAESKGLEFVTYGLEDSFVMWVDADKMQKIVMNLLSNAIKYTPRGGNVSLSFDVVTRDEAATVFPLTEADTDGQYAKISVADTGPGIPEEEMEKIFERFYQIGSDHTHGSGIGLFYSKSLTELHHGYIKVWNRPEGGAVFSVLLPVSASSYTEEERTSEAPQLQMHAAAVSLSAAAEDDGAEKKHIAVVDDDIDIANYIKVLLLPHYKVSLYFDPSSALAGMAENAPDLVISDVVMPGGSGYELCESIKSDLQLSHIPVVLVTAKVAVENQVAGLAKGADAYVTKPFQPAYLLALVKSLLENREKLHRQLGSVTTAEELAPESLSPRDAAFMKDLYELMEKELSNADLDITRISEMMRMSRTKFYYKVKGLTGENPAVFFKRYKLNRAADLLREGHYNMSEIAYMTGFNTLSHFSTSFKKQFGIPPSEYTG